MKSPIYAMLSIFLIGYSNIFCENNKYDWINSRESTVIIAIPDITALLPDKTDADHLVFLPLASLTEDGRLEGRLAESWEHSPDYREWTYHLRPNIF